MKKFMQKARSTFQDSSQASFPASAGYQQTLKQQDTPSTIEAPTSLDVLRYRYHHGTNLGSVFVLEQWLSGSMFEEGAAGASELDAVNASIQKHGIEATRQKWENHWATAVSDADWSFIVDVAQCTTIRLPIGYFTLGPEFCAHTPFAGKPAEVYTSAWSALQRLAADAHAHGIGVLLDLHALPGGANSDAHSGTSSGKADLWGSSSSRDLATRCAVFVASQARAMPGVVGLQLCNEAVYGAAGMHAWYDAVLAALAPVDPALPVYISDAWDLSAALRYSNARNPATAPTNPVVVDTHRYYTFSDADRSQGPDQILARVPHELGELATHAGNVFDRGAAAVVVGEWSCVLDDQTWGRLQPGQSREETVRAFGRAQSARWQDAAGGSFFWTWKMDWMDGGEWGFVKQTKAGAVPAPWSLALSPDAVRTRLSRAQEQMAGLRAAAAGAHADHWARTAPQGSFEHWRYDQGWDVGWADAAAFFGKRADGGIEGAGPGADTIGLLDLWVRKRIVDGGMGGPLVWEFEQGVRRGVADFGDAVRQS